ncbi:MAG TPA: PVC-type heme-binding CxxCH protein, partial [Planctomycetota bacterium]
MTARTIPIPVVVLAAGVALAAAGAAPAQEAFTLQTFERRQLDAEFRCEGASFGDFDRDGHGDVVSGPFWYAGPDFAVRHEIFAPKTFDPLHYSDNFFAFPYDFDADGWLDVFFVGFPGQQATWYENPRGKSVPWLAHQVFDVVDNESPGFGDLTGDGRPELVCQTGGRFGWAEPDWNAPGAPWRFHAISTDLSLGNFTHGLGYGDVDGDGRADVLERNGWWQQPASLAGDPLWIHHPFPFSQRRGGAQMFAYDVDGDGDHDVITSLDAHGFGLSWFEQVRTAAEGITFREHRILDARPEDNRFGVSTSQLHALDLVDVDGDGLADIVTGKRYWAHGPSGDPGSDAPPELYWFALHRDGKGGAEFVPHLIDADSGVGVQVVAGDVDGDGAPDVVVGNKKGTFVFLQKRTVVDRERWQAAQPKPLPTAADTGPVQRFGDGVVPRNAAGEALNLGFESGSLQDWTATGTAFEGQPVRGDTVEARRGDMVSRHAGRFWIGGYELHGDEATGTLSSAPFKVSHPFGSFLVAGGSQASVRVELVRATDGVVLFKTSGPNHETMQRMVVDLQPFLQQEIFVRLVDEAEGGWGHLNFDDFLFHATRPAVDPVRGLPEIHPNQPLQENGFAPEAAARAMTVPEGFAVELIAGEPDLHQPIAFAIDSKGRLWVAEAFSYPTRRPEGQGLDKILVFEDADGDGSFETRTVFAEGLNLVSGLAVGFGGVWIGAAPQFLFFPDADDDLVPDGAPQVLLDGWGYQDTHETLNSFIWGPDGWLYGCHGVFTHSRVGPPGTKDSERTPMNAGVWRYHPVRHEFEVFAWGTSNPWGVDFDDHGQAMVTACVIPHLFHMVQGGRYHRQGGQHFNPYTYDDIKTVADHAHYAGGVGEHAWWGRNEPVAHAGTDLAGGGHAHCGAMIYLGDSFPPEYRDTLFMNNIHGNRMNRDILETEGSAVMGRHGPDFLRANDQWYRGVSIQYGPDGGVYFIDWYDRQACHRNEVEIWDRSNGRLYKVAYGDPAPVKVALDELDDLALVELQLHPNDWYVRHARRILQERGGSPAVHAALVRILRSDRPETVRLRALWALHCTGGLDEKRGLALLDDSGAYLQAWTVQLLLERGKVSARLLQRMVRLARETTSPVVRLYLASALQRMPLAQRWELAAVLVAHAEDAADHNLPYLIWYGTEALVEADPARALQLAQQAQIPLVARFLARRAAASTACHDALVQALRKPSDGPWVALLLEETSEALDKERNVAMPAGWPAAYAELVRSEVRVIRERAQAIAVAFGDASAFPALRRILADPDAGAEARERALEALLRGKDAATVPILQTMLVDKNMRASALRALASFDDPRTPARILAVYPELGAAERRTALHTLVSRPSFAKVLLRAVTA